ncbi:MAG: hypothetical protein JWQ45_2226 [Blastococcus sp.]|nr:hypothetical protein [Blastococcus sp.]
MAPLAHRVAGDGVLDLDDLGPHVAEQLTTERSHDELAELEHPKVRERTVGRRLRGDVLGALTSSSSDLLAVQAAVNSRPRKVLDWETRPRP